METVHDFVTIVTISRNVGFLDTRLIKKNLRKKSVIFVFFFWSNNVSYVGRGSEIDKYYNHLSVKRIN